MTMFLVGGGIRPGVCQRDRDIGAMAVECVHPIRDLRVTLLHRIGLDDNKLTDFRGGRFEPFSQFGGEVIKELIA